MNRECKCGGSINGWATNRNNEHIYKGLGVCIDCNKDYYLKDGEYKFLSKAEFRRITMGRRNRVQSPSMGGH